MFPPSPTWQHDYRWESRTWAVTPREKLGESPTTTNSGAQMIQKKIRKVDHVSSRDLIIGLADGLTVPFALTAGLSALGSSHIVVVGGLAELFSGAISMGVGGYFSTKAERDNYSYVREQTHERMKNTSMISFEGELYDIFTPYGLDHKTTQRMSRSLYVKDLETGDALTEFVMKFGEGLEPISKWRVYISAVTIGLSYFVGGLIPMIPYFILENAYHALYVSTAITGVVLVIFGAVKGLLTGSRREWIWLAVSAFETLAVGALAAASSYGIVRLVNRP